MFLRLFSCKGTAKEKVPNVNSVKANPGSVPNGKQPDTRQAKDPTSRAATVPDKVKPAVKVEPKPRVLNNIEVRKSPKHFSSSSEDTSYGDVPSHASSSSSSHGDAVSPGNAFPPGNPSSSSSSSSQGDVDPRRDAFSRIDVASHGDISSLGDLESKQQQQVDDDTTRELVKRYFVKIWNRGEVDDIPNVCSSTFSLNGYPNPLGHEGFRDVVRESHNGFKLFHAEIHSIVVEGNKAFCRMLFTGIHNGEYLGYRPTGNHISWMGATEFTIKEGRIDAVWQIADLQSMRKQLSGSVTP
jgi:predicted ester cyclase